MRNGKLHYDDKSCNILQNIQRSDTDELMKKLQGTLSFNIQFFKIFQVLILLRAKTNKCIYIYIFQILERHGRCVKPLLEEFKYEYIDEDAFEERLFTIILCSGTIVILGLISIYVTFLMMGLLKWFQTK